MEIIKVQMCDNEDFANWQFAGTIARDSGEPGPHPFALRLTFEDGSTVIYIQELTDSSL